MALPERTDEQDRDYASPATWGDVESVRHSMETRLTTESAEVKVQLARLEAQIAEARAEAKAENAEVRAEIAEARAEAKAENAKTRESVTRLIVIGGGIAVAILGGLQAFA